jgi:transcriptional regulator with XRE-family HTH domain
MNDFSYNSIEYKDDDSLLRVLGRFVQHHRLQQNKTQESVAKEAGISRSTLSLLEQGERVAMITFIRVLRTLNLLHMLEGFQISQRLSPIEEMLILKEKATKYRASNRKSNNSDWEINEDIGW